MSEPTPLDPEAAERIVAEQVATFDRTLDAFREDPRVGPAEDLVGSLRRLEELGLNEGVQSASATANCP